MFKRRYLVVAILFSVGFLFVFMGCKLKEEKVPKTYEELLAWPIDKLDKVDIARMNLICATGLPGAENLDVEKALQTIDAWGELAKRNEIKYESCFAQNLEKYERSYALFRAVYLGLTLKEDINCVYSRHLLASGAVTDWTSIRFFKDSRDLFIHGFVERHQGTCSSFPVLMVALGRRLGYPMYIVSAKGHLFCRWEDGYDRYNLEVSNSGGVDTKSDEEYMNWPHTATKDDIKYEKLFVNMSPAQELATFIDMRGTCYWANQQYKEARDAYQQTLKYQPDSRVNKALVKSMDKKYKMEANK